MITFEQAQNIVAQCTQTVGTERVSLFDALGRVVSQTVTSDTDLPPFHKSAMDGFAVRICDRDKPLEIIETLSAGSVPTQKLGENQCSRIMTGAMVPDGADCVVMKEDTEIINGRVVIRQCNDNRNICYKGEDVATFDVIYEKGRRLTPSDIAVLASVGYDYIEVYKKPVVGIIATGNELVTPGTKPQVGQIRDSNSYQLYAQIVQAGFIPIHFGICKDEPEAIRDFVFRSIPQCDILLITGGVSAGDYDFVPQVLKDGGCDILFHKLSVKPGSPTLFCKQQSHFIFGLAGNPVSTFVMFELLVKPLGFRLMGYPFSPLTVNGRLRGSMRRKNAARLEFVPVSMNKKGEVSTITYHGSGHIHALTEAFGLVAFHPGCNEMVAFSEVEVIVVNK